ncbi:MAG: beta-galactosidase [Bacteroidetes bacterium]|nr:beta-galactosidase [Bacteroidota bacterium]
MKKWSSLFLLLFFILAAINTPAQEFAIVKDQFLMNGKPYRILSGSMHYSRIPEAYQRDRLKKAKAMGLNTIDTYVFWNMLEPEPGKFDFTEQNNIAKYIRVAKEEGLNVILRPGPYVCSEWDFGGLPAWLLKDPDIRVRCLNKNYMNAVEKYIMRLGKELSNLQISKGGPIIMIQIENEYGSYGNDREYLVKLSSIFHKAGFDVPFFTSDAGDQYIYKSVGLNDALPVVNFGSNPQYNFRTLNEFRSGIPNMSGEYWVGWFTYWGDKKWGTQDWDRQKKEIEWMLDNGKSINFYMFHGGTNFGFYAGANWDKDKYNPDITSYDYDAPLDEAGNPTKKYYELSQILSKYQPQGTELPKVPEQISTINIPEIKLTKTASLFNNLPQPKISSQVHSMEYYGQNLGYILYRTKLVGRPKKAKLVFNKLHDYAQIYLDGKFIGTVYRNKEENSMIELPETDDPNPTLDVVVEALGRINFGPRLLDRKGITNYVELNGVTLMNWKVYNLPMNYADLNKLKFTEEIVSTAPAFYSGHFDLEKTGDTFLDLSKWKKGFVFVNGHNLGRYWDIGPQYDLYLPGVWLKKGRNEIIIFDLLIDTPAPLSSSSMRNKD